MRILRGLSGKVVSCGCLVGVYETYDGQVVTILDATSASCTIPSHRDGNMIPNEPDSEKPSVGTRQATARPSRRG